MGRLIDEDDAINAIIREYNTDDSDFPTDYQQGLHAAKKIIAQLPTAQPETSRIEQELHGKTPEEQYKFLYWLLLKFGLAYTDSRLAVIEWLRGEKKDE